MLLTCPHCGDATEIAEGRLPPPGARGSCRACHRTAVFDGSGLRAEDEDSTPPNPLHPQGAASPDDETPPNPLEAVASSGATAPPSGSEPWHVNTPQGQRGPLTLHQVKAMIRTGELSELDHVYGPGDREWTLAGDREELKRFFAIKAKAAGAAAVAGAGAAAAGVAEAPREFDPFAFCTRHPRAEAEWTCTACMTAWCPACTVEKTLPGGVLRTCPNCERPCARREKKKAIIPWWTELGEVFRYPVKGSSWIAIVVLCLIWLMQFASSGAGFYGTAARWILSFGVLSWYLLLIRHVGEGGRDLPNLGDVADYRAQLLWPGVKAFIVSILAFLPVVLYALFVALPAVGQYAMASQIAEQVEELPQEDDAAAEDDEDWQAASSSSAGVAEQQRQAFIEAMRQSGASEEQIEQMLAEFDARQGPVEGAEDGGWEAPEPWRPERPNGAVVFVKLLGIPALLAYTLMVWPVLMIIVALFNTIAPAFNPPLVLRIVQEVWPAYLKLMFLLAPLLFVDFFLDVVTSPDLGSGARLALLGVPTGLRLFLVPFQFYLQLVMMYAIGRTAEIIDAEIDWF